ncbi:hypothetical protein F503_08183 [Ophiostoma piceae UAMH 11346]|uniref:Uncharacterized protein n=1 Tax=Ophiostoma piceae (strain UAMH 11346) TaxID=1262450 RepID=S3BYN4_OPHP1|nr:hypothetical protein F503_08183 [Ophiostoma piceae UAMH 11346]
MAQTNNPMPDLSALPPVSRRTIPISGIIVDFYGIEELAADTESVSLLWLHHPRLRSRGDMAEIAARCVHAVNDAPKPGRKHGLVAAAFDQRNHGSRLVSSRANKAWREGNTTHAQDMLGMIAGTVADQQLLLDLVDTYIHKDGDATYDDPVQAAEGLYYSNGALPSHIAVTQHLQLGVSLGGHSGWQLLFADERVTAGVLIIGCPDYMDMMADRARLTKLPSYVAATESRPFFGSHDFSTALVDSCRKHDPKGIVFGLDTPAWPAPGTEEEERLHSTLKRHLTGKRLLVCSGGADKLVPYRCVDPFMSVFKKAADTWPDLSLTVINNIYDGIGHSFSSAMVQDAVEFVVETVSAAPTSTSSASQSTGSPKTSKI